MDQYKEEDCSLLATLKIIGRKWISLILSEILVSGPISFSNLLTKIRGLSGKRISARALTDSLDVLLENQLLEREIIQERPFRVHYHLTEKGRDVEVIFAALKGWGIKWGGIKHKKCRSFTCFHNGVPSLDIDRIREFLYLGD
ncbi:MAG: winged helix-turn-helix transcriptional regulator [Candidatus Thorarchaeota archaeon]